MMCIERSIMQKFIRSFIVVFIITSFFLILGVWSIVRPIKNMSEEVMFVVPQEKSKFSLSEELEKQQVVRSAFWYEVFSTMKGKNSSVVSGGYRLSPSMTMWQIMEKVNDHPDLVWITVREGLRKEQIGESLAMQLGWNDAQLDEWNNVKNDSLEYKEGVYFPDTYLLPLDETPEQIAKRFIDKFNETIGPLLPQFAAKNIKWTTGVKIASLIEREAAGPQDMKLISGIIWKRLEIGMKLEIDATMQYTKGKVNGKWWGSIDLLEKQSDSPYNTYKYKGLPPTPISNPGLAAIEASLNPEDTACIFYLHDNNQNIHCAETYAEHKENIQKYLVY